MNDPQTLNITHIASGDLWAGAEVQLYTLCKELNLIEDISINVILLNHGTLEQKLGECGIPVEVLDETKLSGLRIGWRLFKRLWLHKPDIIHTHRLKENILGSLTSWLAGIQSLRTVHGAPEHHPSWLRPHKRLLYLVDWLTGRYLQTNIVAVSEELKCLLTNKYQRDKLKVIENGVDIESLAPYQKQPPAEDNHPQGPYKVGLVGRLVPVKRADLFIQTAKYLSVHHPELPFQFHIYGDGPLRTELEQLAKTLEVENIMHFEGHCTHIHPQIASLDALLIPSDHEGFP